MVRHCPALLVAAPASGQGKTTLTAALARLHVRQGRRVRVFKCGPDFLDPMILARASAAPVYQLDLWMVGHAASRRSSSMVAAPRASISSRRGSEWRVMLAAPVRRWRSFVATMLIK